MRVVVVGAGGLGSYLGAVLDRAGHDVTLVARGAHAEAIHAHGLHVTTVEGDFVARPALVSPDDALPPADLAILATKALSLDEVAPSLAELSEGGAVVLPVLNGVTASERLVGHGLAGDRLVDGIAYMTAFRNAPGEIQRHAAHHRLVIGSTTGGGDDAFRVVSDAFAGTTITVEVSPDILVDLWRKMAVVCSLSVLCGLTGHPMGPVREHPFGKELQRIAIAEVIAVGRACGAALGPTTEGEIGTILDAFPEDFHPSVIHDLKSGKRTEMGDLGGVVVELGDRHGIGTPLHRAATAAIQMAEPA